jgi:hypothetical protein
MPWHDHQRFIEKYSLPFGHYVQCGRKSISGSDFSPPPGEMPQSGSGVSTT